MSEFFNTRLGEAVEFIKNGTTATQLKIKSSKAVTRIETIAEGKVNLGKVGFVGDAEDIERYRLITGDILFSHINSIKHIGKTALIRGSEEIYNGMNLLQIRPNTRETDPSFLHELLRSDNFRAEVRRSAKQAVNQASISIAQLQELEICLPPLSEQKKIAEILSGIDRAIEARKRTADKITTTCRFVADEILQQAKYTYGSIKIKDCANRLWQGINTAADRVEYHERGVPILQAKHITSGQIDSGGARFLCEGDYSRYSCRFQPSVGDILFTNIGTIGKSAIVTTPSKFLVAWNIFLISPSDAIESEYLHCFMQVLDQQNYFHQHAAGNATKFINKTLISELEVPLPPREEQIKICARIKALSRAAKCSQDAASKHLELKTSLSVDLLSGRKRVSI